MALTVSTRSYIGKGQWYIAPLSAEVQSGPLLPVGNVSAANFSITEDKKVLKEYRYLGGGNKDSQSRISEVTGSITVHDFSPENLALSIRGTKTAVTAGAVTDEAHDNVFAGSFVPFNYLPDPSVAFVVKKGVATLVANTDYTVAATGVQLISGGAVVDGDDILVSYTKNKSVIIQALVASASEYMLYFEGLNEADGGNPQPLSIHRVKFSPTSGLGQVSDDYDSLTLAYDVLSNSKITGVGLSKFFKYGLISN